MSFELRTLWRCCHLTVVGRRSSLNGRRLTVVPASFPFLCTPAIDCFQFLSTNDEIFLTCGGNFKFHPLYLTFTRIKKNVQYYLIWSAGKWEGYAVRKTYCKI